MESGEIPLYNKAGEVVAVALVDADVCEQLAPYRWYRNAYGYAVGRITTGKFKRQGRRGPKVGGAAPSVYMHRWILGLPPGDKRRGDHINRDRLDNRRSNLRVVDMKANAQNKSSYGRGSKYRGVAPTTSGKWKAYGDINGKRTYIGCTFLTEEEAAAAAAEWRAQNMPYSEEAQTV
jgi:hypothetical protein